MDALREVMILLMKVRSNYDLCNGLIVLKVINNINVMLEFKVVRYYKGEMNE